MTVTKADLIDSVYNQVGFSRTKSTELVETLMETIKTRLADGEDVLISGFGKFSVREKRQRRGRNPATGTDLMLAERRIVTFKCSQVLRDRINGNAPTTESTY